MASLATMLIGPVANLIDSAIKRWGPAEKMSEKDKAELAQIMQLEILKQDWSSVEKEYQDRADARALAAKDVEKGNAFTGILAATVRPIWGFASLVVVAYPYAAAPMGLPSVTIDESTKSIIQTVIMFYFGGRTIEKVLPLIKGK